MKLKFLFSLLLLVATFSIQAQAPVPTVEPQDLSTFRSGVDCYASDDFMVHAYENKLDLYSEDGVLRTYIVKNVKYITDSVGNYTKIYTFTNNVKVKVKIFVNGSFKMQTPFDTEWTNAYQYEFKGVYVKKLFTNATTAFYFPYTSQTKNLLSTPWGDLQLN